MDINEFLRFLQEALKNDAVKKEILKIVNETDDNFVSRSESNTIEIVGNDKFLSAISIIQKEYKKVNNQINELNSNLNEKENIIQNFNKDIKKLKESNENKISNLETELIEKNDKISALKKDIEKLNSEKTELERIKNSEISEKDKKIESLEDINSELENEKKDLEKEIENQKEEKNEQIENLENKNSNLEDELKNKNSDIQNLNSKIENLENNKNELQQQNDKLNSQLSEYEKNCKKEIEVYNKYLSLNDEIKDILKGFFKGDSLSDFISCGVLNIENLWDAIAREITDNKLENDEIEILADIFYFLFEKYRVSEDKFELLDTKENDIFDINSNIKHNKSPENSGIITKVYLKGYKNINKDKIIKQSIVKVG